DFVHEKANDISPIMDNLLNELEEETDHIEGVLIEDKGVTISVHYRLANEEDESEIEDVVREKTDSFVREGLIEVNPGKKIFEIRPKVDWDKGKAVSLLRD
ncbi:MAG: trehalose-phosphatase, partial [Candidatus Aenigmatarchaeota archaeon]